MSRSKRENKMGYVVNDSTAMDAEHSINFKDDLTHTMILGKTGSGKTASVILPGLELLIKEGFSVLLLDTKGKLDRRLIDINKDGE